MQSRIEFLESPTESNIDFVAKQLLQNLNEAQLVEIKVAFNQMEEILFKGWSREMSFNDLKEAIDKADKYQSL